MASLLSPAMWHDVSLTEGFWQQRQDVNRRITLPIQYKRCDDRIESLSDTIAGRRSKVGPHEFWPSDVAKWIEASAYSLATHPDKSLKRKVDRVIDLFAQVQMRDGYINPYYQQGDPKQRWTNLRDMHELYCLGHLMEAATAYQQGLGDAKLLKVMCKAADLVGRKFGRGNGQKRGYPGHPEIELALVKLHEQTGEKRYLDLAKYFIDERGRKPYYFNVEAKARGGKTQANMDYAQAHLPVRQQTEAVGHAVRACYLYCGMVDVARQTGDRELLAACKRIFKNIVARRMYVTGGIGSNAKGELFTFDHDLPNEEAYAETCAAISLVFFAHRLLHATGDAMYADVMERCLYNGVISGVSLSGDEFFYANYLASHPPYHDFAHRYPGQRQEWFGCACCPPNIARLLASFGQYVYSTGPREIQVNLFTASTFNATLAGAAVSITQVTEYPWRKKVRIKVDPDKPMQFTLSVRAPGWCKGAKLAVNGKPVALGPITRKGFARIKRQWSAGDRVELTLPMPAQHIEAHPHVRHNAGRVALQRGPVVYCLEEADNGKHLTTITLPRASKLTAKFEPKLLGGVTTLTAKAQRIDADGWNDALYRPAGAAKTHAATIRAVPYCVWANRKPGEMIVWIRSN